jgi:hypothetical protein
LASERQELSATLIIVQPDAALTRRDGGTN